MNIQQSYREASVQGANPVELVVRLYEQMIEDLRQVDKAIEQKNIRLRTERIKHVILILGHLQSSLDFSQGGKVARNLENLYNTLRDRLVALQVRPTSRAVAQLITDLLAVREAWIQVERAEYPPPSGAAGVGSSEAANRAPTNPSAVEEQPRLEWNV